MVERYINAAKDGYLDILREATRKDLNTQDDDGMTATLWAAQTGNLEALRLIVGREGDVNKSDYYGLTCLHHAALKGHLNVVSYLVNWGCNVFALDNDLHSALDLAAMNEHNEIVKFLDADLAQRQTKNPRHVSKQKEDAMKVAEHNIKRYEKLQDIAAKRAEKEQKKMQKEIDNQQHHNGTVSKPGFFKSLTMRMKGGNSSSNNNGHIATQSQNYTDLTHNLGTKGRGIGAKIQKKRQETLTRNSTEFKVRDTDNRTLRSLGPGQGIMGSTSEVMYMTDANRGLELNGVARRPMLPADMLQKSNLYKPKSEGDLLDSGVDSFNGDFDDEENMPGMFNRPEFGKLAFFGNRPFVNTLQSFDDPSSQPDAKDALANSQRLSGDGQELTGDFFNDSHSSTILPWNQDDLGNLDDDDEDGEDNNELSAVNMFLWSCGLASNLHIFSQEKIDMALLTNMTDADLKELGLPFGPRKKLRDAIANRKSVLETKKKMTDTYL